MRRSAHAPWGVTVVAALAVVAGCGEDADPPSPSGGPVPPSSSPRSTSAHSTGVDRQDGDVEIADTIATGLETPWDVDFLPDGAALVTLRDSGEILRMDGGRATTLDAGGEGGAVPGVEHESEDGLLGLAIGPDQGVYVYLTTRSDNRVVRFDLSGDSLINPEVVLEGIPTHENHSGGRLAFGPDGFLYVTTGDARGPDQAQDTDSLAGKILRVTPAGDPAPGNPFGNEVWSYGHRNVQGIGWSGDGAMYASEFGSSEYDELNLIESGGNYGWPHTEGWAGKSDYVDPLVTWSTDEASPSGIAVVDGGIWVSALRGERLWFVPLGGDGAVGTPRDHRLGLGRLRAVVAAPEGGLWVVTSNTDGRGDPGDRDDQIVHVRSY